MTASIPAHSSSSCTVIDWTLPSAQFTEIVDGGAGTIVDMKDLGVWEPFEGEGADHQDSGGERHAPAAHRRHRCRACPSGTGPRPARHGREGLRLKTLMRSVPHGSGF